MVFSAGVDPGFFLGGFAALRNRVTDWWRDMPNYHKFISLVLCFTSKQTHHRMSVVFENRRSSQGVPEPPPRDSPLLRPRGSTGSRLNVRKFPCVPVGHWIRTLPDHKPCIGDNIPNETLKLCAQIERWILRLQPLQVQSKVLTRMQKYCDSLSGLVQAEVY